MQHNLRTTFNGDFKLAVQQQHCCILAIETREEGKNSDLSKIPKGATFRVEPAMPVDGKNTSYTGRVRGGPHTTT